MTEFCREGSMTAARVESGGMAGPKAKSSSFPSSLSVFRPIATFTVACFLHTTANYAQTPVLTDVLVAAICNGRDECSEVLFLSGIAHTITGIAALALGPFVGSLSDEYGRKTVLLCTFTATAFPPAILSFGRTRSFVYAYYVTSVIANTIESTGGVAVVVAYVADTVKDERHRGTGISFVLVSLPSGILAGTAITSFLSIEKTFQVATAMVVLSVLFLKFFVPESNPRKPLLPGSELGTTAKFSTKILALRVASVIGEAFEVMKTSHLLRTIAVLGFLVTLAEVNSENMLLFYLKSNFGFGKDQYTLAQMIIGGVSIFLKVVGYPVLASFSGERTILLISLMGIAASNFLYSISWAPWVAYLCGGLGALAALFLPASGSVTTIAAGSDEQGKVQGLLASTNKLAGVISPIVVTPLTAAFFSDNPPFNFPGLPFMIGGIAVVVAMAFVLVLPSERKPATQTSQYLLANEEENSVAGN